MSERVITFGEQGELTGILSQPAVMRRGAPWLLLWNTGVQHRVGPCRLNVQLARRLAERGIPSLRFDLSGLGDSAPRADRRSGRERAASDARSAMALLEQRLSATRFAVLGLCTGADYAYNAAVTDERVTAFVCLDGLSYPTFRFGLERLRSFLSSRTRILSFLRRACGRFPALAWRRLNTSGSRRSAAAVAAGCTGSDLFGWAPPPRREAEEAMRTLVQRGTRSLWIYSGEELALYNYREQFRDMFAGIEFNDTVEVDYFKESDHLFSDAASRERLLNRVCLWMDQICPEEPDDP
ncbi:MAG: hypothetical protein HQ523_13885 [Lentisphaerae bacterium]|nr:hypothetical protein [Lentisphaerota bacterium]